ncbi:uncharacterized protein LOC122380158 [Amphibalanus amphitrite]|uniref:uncharacterized protein LOC122380158 n=1 Tax=Amphibalanus amphitrite TaxID=1232801 RepID=UPI001C915224|nr:uncharacterized protein LOC122380158 [Amphibalanus amphitrite]
MEEIFVIRLRSPPATTAVPPSEQKYSAETVLGLGGVHLVLAALALLFGALALALEPDAQRLGAAGWIWALFAVTGTSGALAGRRWYENAHIRWFCVLSAASAAGAAQLAALTVTGLVERQLALDERRRAAAADPFTAPLSAEHERRQSLSAASANLLVTALLELGWSVVTACVAWRGWRAPEASVTRPAGGGPDLLRGVPRPLADCQVARMNPLCADTSTLDYRERVQRFLDEALELAARQSQPSAAGHTLEVITVDGEGGQQEWSELHGLEERVWSVTSDRPARE